MRIKKRREKRSPSHIWPLRRHAVRSMLSSMLHKFLPATRAARVNAIQAVCCLFITARRASAKRPAAFRALGAGLVAFQAAARHSAAAAGAPHIVSLMSLLSLLLVLLLVYSILRCMYYCSPHPCGRPPVVIGTQGGCARRGGFVIRGRPPIVICTRGGYARRGRLGPLGPPYCDLHSARVACVRWRYGAVRVRDGAAIVIHRQRMDCARVGDGAAVANFSQDVVPCHVGRVLSGCVVSRHVMSRRVVSRHVISGHVMLRCYAVSCPVMSHHVMSCQEMSRRVMSRHVMPCHVVSCRFLSCRIAPCHVATSGHNTLTKLPHSHTTQADLYPSP